MRAAFAALASATAALAAPPTQVQLHPSAPNAGELSVDFVGAGHSVGGVSAPAPRFRRFECRPIATPLFLPFPPVPCALLFSRSQRACAQGLEYGGRGLQCLLPHPGRGLGQGGPPLLRPHSVRGAARGRGGGGRGARSLLHPRNSPPSTRTLFPHTPHTRPAYYSYYSACLACP